MALNQEHSGIFIWLHEQIRERMEDGDILIDASKAYGSNKYPWLLDRLKERGATDLVEEFRQRRNVEQKERSWELKRLRLVNMDQRIANRLKAGLRGDDSYSLHLQKKAEKLRKSIEKHDAQQQGEIKDDRAESE